MESVLLMSSFFLCCVCSHDLESRAMTSIHRDADIHLIEKIVQPWHLAAAVL